MDSHRLVSPASIKVLQFSPPFSSFEYVEQNHGSTFSIQRLFSLGRSGRAQTLVIEEIPAVGLIEDENGEIRSLYSDYSMDGLHRISFWTSRFNPSNIDSCKSDDCLGYGILKHDVVPSNKYDRWHVFEAVFKKYPDPHNCVPFPASYQFQVAGVIHKIQGLLYAQQNTLNKACAHVALRSLLSRAIQGDVAYSTINSLARKVLISNPKDGLTIDQIRSVLDGFNVSYHDYEYTGKTDNERKSVPFDKYVYAGIESGFGALIGFRFTGPQATDHDRHIIPFYGHTFNKDTWAPEAEKDYFHIGNDLGYFPSDNWTSSFLSHDDNYGPNFCIPRLYLSPTNVEYVVELHPPNVACTGAQAEAYSLGYLSSVLHELVTKSATVIQNQWLARLIVYHKYHRIVLRAVATTRERYIAHLTNEKDWIGNSEENKLITGLASVLPKTLWVVEISIPQLFPANERKLGEILLNGELSPLSDTTYKSCFVLARLPGYYVSVLSPNHFRFTPSGLASHLQTLVLC